MYIAIEGIKGSGKTTVFELTCALLAGRGFSFETLRPTQPLAGPSLVELLHRKTGHRWPDWAIERLYAMRSNHHTRRLPKRCPLIIGERSVLTSYVTRWIEDHPQRGMSRVDRLEHLISIPDHVIYLHISPAAARMRISLRACRRYGARDETLERLQEAYQRYAELAAGAERFGLGGIQWHNVDASQDLSVVVRNVIVAITELLPRSRLEPALSSCGVSEPMPQMNKRPLRNAACI